MLNSTHIHNALASNTALRASVSVPPPSRVIEQNAFYSPPETAVILGVAVRTLEDWRRDGRGPAYTRFGAKSVRYKGEALLAHAANCTFNSTSEETALAA
jgi:hypothetical protein